MAGEGLAVKMDGKIRNVFNIRLRSTFEHASEKVSTMCLTG
jgi:hypothetical protein